MLRFRLKKQAIEVGNKNRDWTKLEAKNEKTRCFSGFLDVVGQHRF